MGLCQHGVDVFWSMWCRPDRSITIFYITYISLLLKPENQE